jgi:uncharacterized protein involved in exopolysaccharide biosynthesis
MATLSQRDGGPEAAAARRREDAWFDEGVSFWRLGAAVVRKRRLLVGLWGLGMVIGVTIALVLIVGRDSRATFSFVPHGSDGGSRGGLASIAAQYGVALATGEESRSPEFYASLVHSRRVLASVAGATYWVEDSGDRKQMSLLEFLRPRQPPANAREDVIKQLRSKIRVRVARETGVVHITVMAPQPDLARQVAQRVLDEVQHYNISVRQSSAAAERRFVEERLQELGSELTEAEAALGRFLQHNRQFENSPELRLAYDRLQREVVRRQQAIGSLAPAFEQARIEEVRNTPVITVIEEPETAVESGSRAFVRILVLAGSPHRGSGRRAGVGVPVRHGCALGRAGGLHLPPVPPGPRAPAALQQGRWARR